MTFLDPKKRIFFWTRIFLYVILVGYVGLLNGSDSREKISYSGRITNTEGIPIPGPVNIRFKLYNASNTVLCQQDKSSVELTNGVFNVSLDFEGGCGGSSLMSILSANATVYMEVTENPGGSPEKVYPKQAITSVPYALYSLAAGVSVTKSDVGLSNVENTAISTWAGSSNITTIGTITSGTVPVARVSGLGTLATKSSVDTAEIAPLAVTNAEISLTAAIDPQKLGTGTVDSMEFGYLNGVTSAIQTQIDATVKLTGDQTIAGEKTFSSNILASTAPSSNSHLANKLYVDGQVAAAGKAIPGYGSDMFSYRMADLGLFTPHTDNCDGTESFVELQSGTGLGFCIEKDERSSASWIVAKKTCLNAGKRLPEPYEWKYSCYYGSGLNNMTDDYEWASNFVIQNTDASMMGVPILGEGNCKYSAVGAVSSAAADESSRVFRCVH